MVAKPQKSKNSPVRALTWQERAEGEKFKLPLEIEGVKVINFSYLDVQMLENNVQKLPAQCRVRGEQESHISDLSRHIKSYGLKEAAVVTKDTISGELMPLTHHRLKAFSENKEKKIPCFEVEITPYYCKQRKTTIVHNRILLNYIGPLGLNKTKPPALPMSRDDVLHNVSELHKYSEFGSYKSGSNTFETAVKDYLKKAVPEWTSTERSKVFNSFMDNVRPRKLEPLTVRILKDRAKIRKEDFAWDMNKNVITWYTRIESLFPGIGPLQLYIYNESLKYAGNDFQKKLSEVKIKFVTFQGELSGKTPKKIRENRLSLMNTLTNLNVHKNAQHIFPWVVDEIVVEPQILEPPSERETAPVSFKWNATEQKFI